MRSLYIPNQEPVIAGEEQAERSLRSAIALFIIVSTAILFGLTVLYSTSYGVAGPMYFKKQLIWASVGAVGGLGVFLVGYRKLVSISPFIIIAAGLLLLVAFAFSSTKGAQRWIKIPHIGNIQPSEYAKLAIALFMAKYCTDKMRNISVWSFKTGFIPGCFVCLCVVGLILAGGDLGTSILICTVIAIMLFVTGIRLYIIVLPTILGVPSGIWLISNYNPERWSRLTTFVDPEKCQSSDGYQLWNSLLALGSGGWTGVGFMNSRLKHKYLPEAHTDFIFSIVGEELGLLGMTFVIIMYLAFIIAGIKISANASSRQGMLLGTGLTALIGLQAFINIGVVTGALPTKGMPAPFISYGGSNLVTCMLAVSLLLSIAIETARPGFNQNIIMELKGYWKKLCSSN